MKSFVVVVVVVVMVAVGINAMEVALWMMWNACARRVWEGRCARLQREGRAT